MLFENRGRRIFISQSPNGAFIRHLHHEIEIRICTEGTLGVICNGERRTLSAGDVMIVFSNHIHEYFETEKGRGYMIIFDPDLSDGIKRLVTEHRYTNFLHAPALIPLFEECFAEYRGDRYIPLLYGYVHTILAKILKSLPIQPESTPIQNDRLTMALQYVSRHCTSPLTLTEVAKKTGISPCHLSRLFSERIPGGFHKYLRALRVHHACELLRSTDQSICGVMYSAGFSNQRTFYRVFKEETGLSPKEYRQKVSS